MENYDVVIIGAGISGLCTGALLAKAGKRVLVLEKMDRVGGRATSYTYKMGGKEFTADYGMARSMNLVDRGAVACVYKEINLSGKFQETLLPQQPAMLIYRHGKWQDLTELNKGENRDDFKKIVNEIASLQWEELDQLDTISFQEWIAKRTSREDLYDWFGAVGYVFTTMPNSRDQSAGDLLWNFKVNLEAVHSLGSGVHIKGGTINLSLPLADYIKGTGGSVRLGAKVTRILTNNGKVTGVQIGELPPSATELDEPETVSVPTVVSTAPIWDILSLIDEGELPHWFTRLVNSYRNPDLLISTRGGDIGLVFLLKDESLKTCFGPNQGREYRVCLDMPYTHGSSQIVIGGAADPRQRINGKIRLQFGSYGFNPELMKDRVIVEQLYESLEKDFSALFPEITKDYIVEKKRGPWLTRFGIIDGLARMPYYTGSFRVDNKGPLEGLYFAGDTVRGRGNGIDAAARSGIWCFNKILSENVPSFLPA
jgi:hypothetical protein